MSHKPKIVEPYKSNPTARGVGVNDKKITTFAYEPSKTRTGLNLNEEIKQRIGDSIMHTSAVGKFVSSFFVTDIKLNV